MRNLLIIFVIITTTNILPRVRSQDGKHNLPDNLEIVDPKSLGFGDADLEKFLGNVKLLPIDGQVGNNVKTEILTVGFDGDEKLNLADFDGLSTDGLPDQEKQVAQAAFQRFQDFFKNPSSSQNFDDAANNGGHSQNFGPRENIQYQQPPRHVTYDQPLQQGQRSQYNRDIFKEITESPRPVTPVVSQQTPMYRLNPQEVMSLLTATEATTRQKSPQIYSLKESAFPPHLAHMMGMGTSIERPSLLNTPNHAPQYRPQQHHASQHSYNTPAPAVPNVHTHRTPPATHNPSYNHAADFRSTPPPYFSAPQQQQQQQQQQYRPSGDTRYTATPSIQQNQYVQVHNKPHSHTQESGQSLANHGTQQQKQQKSLPAPWGTYRPPPAPRQPQKQQEQQQKQQQQQQQHQQQQFHTYFSQNYDLQPSIGFQVRPPPSTSQSGIGNNRGASGHIDQGKPAHLTGGQSFQPAASSHSVTTNTHHASQQASATHNQQPQHGHSSFQTDRQHHLRALKEAMLKQERQHNQNHNLEQTQPNNMLAQIHIHHPNHKQPTILNIHQPQQPNNHNYAQTQAQTQSVSGHPHQKQQHYTQALQYSTIYPQQNQHIQGSNNYFNPHVRQNSPSQQQQPVATHYQRPSASSALPVVQSTQKFSSSASPTSHTPGNSPSPSVLIATTQTPLYHPQSNQEQYRTSKDHKFLSYQQNQNNAIQSSPSYHHSQHLLPHYYQPAPTKATERQRETPQRQPAPPPHPPPPSIPYRNLKSETDARAPRTLAEASLPRRFSYDEWPIHRNYRSDDNDYFGSGSENSNSLQKHTDSSADLLAGGSEHALAITRQLFDPNMIEAIQPAQMIAYGHVTSSEKPEK